MRISGKNLVTLYFLAEECLNLTKTCFNILIDRKVSYINLIIYHLFWCHSELENIIKLSIYVIECAIQRQINLTQNKRNTHPVISLRFVSFSFHLYMAIHGPHIISVTRRIKKVLLKWLIGI